MIFPYGVIGLLVRRSGARKNDPRAVNIGLRLFAFFFVLPMSMACMNANRWLGAIECVVAVMASFPAWTLRFVFVPLGLVRPAYWLARCSPPLAISGELRGGAALMAVLALGRRREVDKPTLDWVDLRLSRELHVQTLSMTAAGLLAALRGKNETTRRLFYAIEAVSPRSPRMARRLARSWLVADAAQRGDWREVIALGCGRGFRMSLRWPHAMGIFARRLTSADPSPSNLALCLAWLLAPHRRASFSILRRALAVPRSNLVPATSSSAPPSASSARDPLDHALRSHAACLRRVTAVTVTAAAQGWDAVRVSAATVPLFARRALALETHTSAETAFSKLLADAEADLAPCIARLSGRGLLPDPVIDGSPTLAAAMRDVRRKALEEVETIARALKRRTAEKRALHISGEWMEWGALRRSCDRVDREGSAATRRAAFLAVYVPACDYGAWLFNVREEKLLANGIFRWLAGYARSVGDASALLVLERNVKVGDGL